MSRIDDTLKQQRAERIWLKVKVNPFGIKESEIASELNMLPRTVNNYLRDLEYEGKVFKEGRLWFPLNLRDTRLRSFELSPEEAVTLYLGARLLAKQQDKRNEPAETALLKLAQVLKSDAGVGDEIEQAARELAQRPVKEGYHPIFRDLVRGYIYRKRVKLRYKPLGWKKGFETSFETYLMEPSPIGFSTYLIGHSSIVDALRAYKLERVESVQLTSEEYGIPANFPGLDILHNAWSIIMGDETVRVVLRFAPGIASERLLETRWHPSEKTEEDPDKPGWLRWTAQVADTMDMIPWIRSWGADVEAVKPEELKKELKQTAKDLSSLYEMVSQAQTPAHHLFWAKADKKKNEFHLLQYHLIDVGNVALALWQSGLNENIRREIKDWLGLSVEDTGRLIAFWTSLHDLGKASPAFQDHPFMPSKLRGRIQRELGAAGFTLPQRTDGEKHARHEVISTWALKDDGLLANNSLLPPSLADLIAQALGGHHGVWPQTELFSPALLKPDDKGNEKWHQARQELIRDLVKVFEPPAIQDFQPNTLKDNLMLTLVSGIVAVADWLGSDEESFPLENEQLPLEVYARHSIQHARYVLCRTQWKNAPAMPKFDFEKVFGFAPTQAQQQVTNTLKQLSLPAIAIIEAPMGSGKTEKAMAVYAQWAKATGYSGLYVAMPTTATSNQMHARMMDFLSTQFGENIEPLLVHSQALLRDVPAESDAVEEKEHEGNRADSQVWFLPRKKSLLTPFGVGTVDQALMSILQTKHFFVRLLGLSHKVVIFDEVHAYDAYMSELFERLLVWLRQINASVIILSATLPDKTRQRLIQAYAGKVTIPSKNYPRLTFAASDGKVNTIELTPPEAKILQFDWMTRDEEAIIKRLADELCKGGCAVVICNTVTRAQKLYEALSLHEEKLCDDNDLILFHARFPMAWRAEIENNVLSRFGPGKDKSRPNPERPQKAIVIATQVVEQSLDLDFDVMISDHAPVDLLLQRAGRLQRHAVNHPKRKHPYRLLIAEPEINGGKPNFGRGDTFVYDEYVLLRSWIVLNRLTAKQITLPTDLPTLIEQVYGDDEPTNEPELLAALANAKEEMTKDKLNIKLKARKRLIPKPDNEDLLWGDNAALEEDDPSVHETFQALTRADRPGINVVCLHRVNGQLLLEPDDSSLVYDPVKKIGKAMARELARRAVSVRHFDPAVEHFLLAEPDDPLIKDILRKWKKVAALRYDRVVIFENGVCRLKGAGYVMRLNKKDKLGLRIEKENL